MTFRETFQQAEFRGVPFHVSASETAVGRRVAVHEFPNRDLPYVEDLGRAGSTFSVDGFIIGDDYITEMERLIGALTKPGPGTLIHPSLGTLEVVLASKARLREQFIQQRGRATFTLQFIEAGEDVQPSIAADTQQLVDAAADDCYGDMEDEFAGGFSVEGAPAWSIESITQELGRAADVLAQVQSGLNFDLTSLSSLLRAGKAFKSNLLQLLATPGALAKELTTLVRGIGHLFDFSAAQTHVFGALGTLDAGRTGLAAAAGAGGSAGGGTRPTSAADIALANRQWAAVLRSGAGAPRAGLNDVPFGSSGRVVRPMDALLRLASYGLPGSPYFRLPVAATTPVRRQQSANQEAVFALVRRIAVVEAVRCSIYVAFDSRDQAAAVRNTLHDAIETLMLDAPDAIYRSLQVLRTAMIRDITERGAESVPLSTVTLRESAPSRILSYRLYGTSAFADEIVARNQRPAQVLHPLCLPGGEKVEVRRA